MSRTPKKSVVILLVVAGLVVLLGGSAAIVVVTFRSMLPGAVSATSAGVGACDYGLSLYFADDAAMRAAADELRRDARVRDVRTETREVALERVADWYTGTAVRPAVASAVHVLGVDASTGGERKRLAADLRKEVRGAIAARPADCLATGEARRAQLFEFGERLKCGQEFTIYFTEDAELAKALEAVRAKEGVDSVRAVTKEEAFEEAKEVFKNDPKVLESLTPSAMQPSLRIRPVDGVDQEALASSLMGALQGARQSQAQYCLTVPNPVVPPAPAPR